MDKQFSPQKYGMAVCPVCNGDGRIRSLSEIRVCQNCGGFGLIKEEVNSFDQKPSRSLQVGSRIAKE